MEATGHRLISSGPELTSGAVRPDDWLHLAVLGVVPSPVRGDLGERSGDTGCRQWRREQLVNVRVDVHLRQDRRSDVLVCRSRPDQHPLPSFSAALNLEALVQPRNRADLGRVRHHQVRPDAPAWECPGEHEALEGDVLQVRQHVLDPAAAPALEGEFVPRVERLGLYLDEFNLVADLLQDVDPDEERAVGDGGLVQGDGVLLQ